MITKTIGLTMLIAMFFLPAYLYAGPAVRSISVAKVDTSSQTGLESLLFQQTLLLDFPGPLTLTAGIGATHAMAGSTEYRPSLGGAWVLPGNFYLDGWYSLYVLESTLEQGAAIALNYETDQLYLAVREAIRYGAGSFSSVSYLDGSWTWTEGSSVTAHAALGITPDAYPEPAGWIKGSWRATPLLAPQMLASITNDATSLNESVGFGCAFYFGSSNISASWEPRFGSRAGESSINLTADLRF
jgi:hypothetical protein